MCADQDRARLAQHRAVMGDLKSDIHCRCLPARRCRLHEKPPLVFFQNQAGQAVCCIGGRVDSDAIGTNLWGDRRRVTVHDKFSVLRLTEQERRLGYSEDHRDLGDRGARPALLRHDRRSNRRWPLKS